ncbi:hypothetical protein [Burkholderia gladioli]|uniref:hypothetical protein n=1 Tax=Burkholderia gladioli TaxID=28095 RepID=UPI0016418160|nr:hypothetical protein [Burkholderia gladioli]
MDPALRMLIDADVEDRKVRLRAENGFLVFFTPKESIPQGECENFGRADEAFKSLVGRRRASGEKLSLNVMPYDGSGPIDLQRPDAGIYWLFCWARAHEAEGDTSSIASQLTTETRQIFGECGIDAFDRTADLDRVLLFVFTDFR